MEARPKARRRKRRNTKTEHRGHRENEERSQRGTASVNCYGFCFYFRSQLYGAGGRAAGRRFARSRACADRGRCAVVERGGSERSRRKSRNRIGNDEVAS